jgi:hypothetical protein
MSAYACDPRTGSEPTVGWNWAKQGARLHEVWVLTRPLGRRQLRVLPCLPLRHRRPSEEAPIVRGQAGQAGAVGVHDVYVALALASKL